MDPADKQLDRMAVSIREALAEENHTAEHLRAARASFLQQVATRNSRRARRSAGSALRRWRLWVAAAATATAMASFWVWRQRPISFRSDIPTVSTTPGDLIEAPHTSTIPLEFSEGSTVVLQHDGRMRVIGADPAGARVLVESGTIDVSIARRRLGHTRWSFEAGAFHVAVTGTRFKLAFEPRGQLFKIDMQEGRVVVSGGCLASPTAVVAGGTLDLACQPPTVPASSPEPLEAPVAARRSAETSEKTSKGRSATAVWREYLASGRLEEGLRMAERLGFQEVCQTATSKELLALADAARLFGRSSRAITALKVLRQRFPDSSDAATAAFSLGRIAFEKHHAYADAAGWFDTCLREEPSGPLMGDAFGRLMEARQRSGDLMGAQKEAQQYLRRFPQGPYASEARGILSK